MKPQYPIFGQDKGKWMFMIDSDPGLNYHLELIDVENKEYVGWDVRGVPIDFYLDQNNIKVKCISEETRLNKLRKAILNYVSLARPTEPFVYTGPNDDIVKLFRAVEQHIEEGRINRGIRRKASEFIKKFISAFRGQVST
jgi:hypothetical protein